MIINKPSIYISIYPSIYLWAANKEVIFWIKTGLVEELQEFCRQPSLGDSSLRQWRHAPTNLNCTNDVTPVPHSKVRSEHRWLLHLSSCMNIKLNGLKENVQCIRSVQKSVLLR